MLNINPVELQYGWTAEFKLKNNQIITIWWTAWYSMNNTVESIVSISSDYPRYYIKDSLFLS